MNSIISDLFTINTLLKSFLSEFPNAFKNTAMQFWARCFQLALKQEGRWHFSAEFIFMRLLNIFADQTGSKNLFLEDIFIKSSHTESLCCWENAFLYEKWSKYYSHFHIKSMKILTVQYISTFYILCFSLQETKYW